MPGALGSKSVRPHRDRKPKGFHLPQVIDSMKDWDPAETALALGCSSFYLEH